MVAIWGFIQKRGDIFPICEDVGIDVVKEEMTSTYEFLQGKEFSPLGVSRENDETVHELPRFIIDNRDNMLELIENIC